MAEEIQYIINQIKKEGVEEASKEASQIIENAKSEAKKIILNAENIYKEKSELAKKEAISLEKKSLNSVKQASRDLLILLGQCCEKIVVESLNSSVKKEINSSFLKELILKVVSDTNKDNMVISVNPNDAKELKDFASNLLKENGNKISLLESNEILKGFTLKFEDENVYLDYSSDSISSALAEFLRPEISKIISEIAEEMTKS